MLLHRDPAAHVSLDDPGAVAACWDSLREAGADEQATALAGRLPAAGMFELFLEQQGRRGSVPFGREADGSPASAMGLGRPGLTWPGSVIRDPGRYCATTI